MRITPQACLRHDAGEVGRGAGGAARPRRTAGAPPAQRQGLPHPPADPDREHGSARIWPGSGSSRRRRASGTSRRRRASGTTAKVIHSEEDRKTAWGAVFPTNDRLLEAAAQAPEAARPALDLLADQLRDLRGRIETVTKRIEATRDRPTRSPAVSPGSARSHLEASPGRFAAFRGPVFTPRHRPDRLQPRHAGSVPAARRRHAGSVPAARRRHAGGVPAARRRHAGGVPAARRRHHARRRGVPVGTGLFRLARRAVRLSDGSRSGPHRRSRTRAAARSVSGGSQGRQQVPAAPPLPGGHDEAMARQ